MCFNDRAALYVEIPADRMRDHAICVAGWLHVSELSWTMYCGQKKWLQDPSRDFPKSRE
jgi:hypothetical protein